jgi:hypothetical protein
VGVEGVGVSGNAALKAYFRKLHAMHHAMAALT